MKIDEYGLWLEFEHKRYCSINPIIYALNERMKYYDARYYHHSIDKSMPLIGSIYLNGMFVEAICIMFVRNNLYIKRYMNLNSKSKLPLQSPLSSLSRFSGRFSFKFVAENKSLPAAKILKEAFTHDIDSSTEGWYIVNEE